MGIYLSIKEIWRNKGRFTLFSLVIALITILVLFIAGLGEGLALANKEYLEKIDGQLLVFQEDTKLSTTASRIGRSTLNQLKRVSGVEAIGPIGFSTASIVTENAEEAFDVTMIGVKPGLPGDAPAFEGRSLRSERAYETVIDESIATSLGVGVGDEITIKTIQGTEDEFFNLEIIGITDGRQYFFQPSIFVPSIIWNKIRPQPITGSFGNEITYNIVALRLTDPETAESLIPIIQDRVDGVEVADIVTAYEAGPGYQEQQSTLNTQRGFTLLIGILVIGGFFQIQTLQKVPNIGMLKAVGASNRAIAVSVVFQILAVTVFGVLLGGLGVFSLALGLPQGIPIVFTLDVAIAAIVSLLIIGPLGGLVSVRMALKVEPLTALGLSS